MAIKIIGLVALENTRPLLCPLLTSCVSTSLFRSGRVTANSEMSLASENVRF